MDVAAVFRSEFALQNHITWVKSISIRQDSHGHFKPIRSERFLNPNHEAIFHFTKSGSVTVDRLAVGVPFADISNIARRGHAQDRRCGGTVWFIPYKTCSPRRRSTTTQRAFRFGCPNVASICTALKAQGCLILFSGLERRS
jgi:site-specific DNA-methyltransferase (adenine-specific)